MKRLLFFAAVLLLFSSCISDEGLQVNLPSSLAKQWLSTEFYQPEGEEEAQEYLCLWDFTVRKGCVYFAYFNSLQDLVTIPQYIMYEENIQPFTCYYKKGTYYIVLEGGLTYYFTDITPVSANVSSNNGYENELSICVKQVNAYPFPY